MMILSCAWGKHSMRKRYAQPTFTELFTPKLVTVLREGYGAKGVRADAVAGLTVAIVALPLSMAIAIGSGVTPDRGLIASVIGGFIVSLLGGSRFQIGGPAGGLFLVGGGAGGDPRTSRVGFAALLGGGVSL